MDLKIISLTKSPLVVRESWCRGAPAGWLWVRKLISTCCVLANYMASGWDLCCTWLAKKQVTRAQKGFLASTPTWCVSRYKRALVQSTSRNRHSLRNHTRRKGGDQEEASHGAQSSRRGMLFLWHLILPHCSRWFESPGTKHPILSLPREILLKDRHAPREENYLLMCCLHCCLWTWYQVFSSAETFLLQKCFDLSAENWVI